MLLCFIDKQGGGCAGSAKIFVSKVNKMSEGEDINPPVVIISPENMEDNNEDIEAGVLPQVIENAVNTLEEVIIVKDSTPENEIEVIQDQNLGNVTGNDEIIVVTVVRDQDMYPNQDIKKTVDMNPSERKEEQPANSEIPNYGLPGYSDIPPENPISEGPSNPVMTDGLPTFNEEMNPKKQSKTVNTLAYICLPFYILFYELPLFIYRTALWCGKTLIWAFNELISAIGMGVILFSMGIQMLLEFIFITCLFKPIAFICQMIFKYIIMPICQGIVMIFMFIGSCLSWIWNHIFVPFFKFLYWIWLGIVYGIVTVLKFIYNSILTPIWLGLVFVVTSIYNGIVYILTQLYRGIKFVVSGIYRGICAFGLLTYQYFLFPVGKVIYQILAAICSGIVYVLTNVYRGIAYMAINIFRGIAFVAIHVYRVLAYIGWNLMLGFYYVFSTIYAGFAFIAYGIATGFAFVFYYSYHGTVFILRAINYGVCAIASFLKNYIFIPIVNGIVFVVRGIYYCVCATASFIKNYIFIPLWNGFKYLCNGFYILASNVFNTCAYIFQNYILMPIYNWILKPIWNYILVPIYRGIVYICRGIASFARIIANAIRSVMSAIYNAIKSVFLAIKGVLVQMFNVVSTAFSAMFNAIRETGRSISAGMRELGKSIREGISETIEGVKASFRGQQS